MGIALKEAGVAGWVGWERGPLKGFVLGICLGLSCSVSFGFCSRRVESFKWRNKHSFVVALEAATTAPPRPLKDRAQCSAAFG